MKFVSALPLIAGLGIVTANPLIQKRAGTGDKAVVGYATLSGGTTGGGSATPATVTTLDQLKVAVAGSTTKVVMVSGTITGNEVVQVGPNTSLLGASGATLSGVGIYVFEVSNVIIRNLKISKVLAEAGDHIGIQASNRVWIDSVEISADQDHDKDYYDGLLDITHGTYATSVTNSYLHDTWKGSLVGHSDSNEAEDIAIQVTFAYNKWQNINSRIPSFRFGHGHIYNNYFLNNNDGIDSRVGAELLIQNNVFEGISVPIRSTNGGIVYPTGNICGGTSSCGVPSPIIFPPSPGYSYTLTAVSAVKPYVNAVAGPKLSWS